LSESLRVALAVNPSSGRGRGRRAGQIAADRLTVAGHDVDILIGKDAADLAGQLQHVLSVSSEYPADRPAALVVAGGDGMVQLGVTALARAGWPAPLGIMPAGTGNDIARALNLAVGDWARSAADVARSVTDRASWKAIDAVCCTPVRGDGMIQDGDERWFTGVLGAGFDAIVNERANGWTWPRGRAKYLLAMLRELPRFRPRDYTLTLDDDVWRSPAMLVAVANAPSYGGGMRVCPEARLDDGLLDVLMVRPLSKPAFLRIFPRVYSGTHVRDPHVEIRRARTVTIDAAGIVGYGDGERMDSLPLRCELVPGALSVLTR
jgi:diacylglycerol kinase (ATP)